MFAGVVRLSRRCRNCGLDIESFNVGDGPAALLILAIGAIVTGLAIWLELAAAPPFWLHLLLWPPVTAAGVVGSLRMAKALLLALEWKNEAREGRKADGLR